MAFPHVVARQAYTFASSTTHSFTPPAGSNGEMLLCIFTHASSVGVTVQPVGWTPYEDTRSSDTGSSGENCRIYWKFATGSDDFSITLSAGRDANVVVYRLSNAKAFTLVFNTSGGNGSSIAYPKHNAVDVFGGFQDALTLAVKVSDGARASDPVPVGFTSQVLSLNGTASTVAVAEAQTQAATVHPSTWETASSHRWVCATICIVSEIPSQWTWEWNVDREPNGSFGTFWDNTGELSGSSRMDAQVVANPEPFANKMIQWRVVTSGFGGRYNSVTRSGCCFGAETFVYSKVQVYSIFKLPDVDLGQIRVAPIVDQEKGSGTFSGAGLGIYWDDGDFKLVSDRVARSTFSGSVYGTRYELRFEVENCQTARAKIWVYGTPEPTAWTATHTATGTFPVHSFGIAVRTDNAGQTSLFDTRYFSIGFDTEAPKPILDSPPSDSPVSAVTGNPFYTRVNLGGVDYEVFEFHSDGSISLSEPRQVQVLRVGGGGGGGGWTYYGTGGGGGGAVIEDTPSLSAATYPVVVGAGGLPGSQVNGLNGGDSSFNGVSASGGGGGGVGSSPGIGNNGGSGGGGSGRSGSPIAGGIGSPGGNGGSGINTSSRTGGGGGGAGGNGGDGDGFKGGDGGNGLVSSITGFPVYYGGGGGGGVTYGDTDNIGFGGLGGGGNGGVQGYAAKPGIDGLGGGGGGAGHDTAALPAQPGGKGVVIIRVPLIASAPTGGLINVWAGTAWVQKPVKRWNGSAWESKPLKYWDGSAWVSS